MVHASTLDIVAKTQLNVLIHLANADKNFVESERELIYRICRAKNFPEEKLAQMIERPDSVDSLGALSSRQKFQYLLDCIDLVLVDEKVMESELIFCRSIAIKMGFRKNVVDFLMEHHLSMPTEQLQRTVLTEFAV